MERKKLLTLIVCIGLVLMLASMLLLATQGSSQTKTSQAKTLKIGYLLCVTGFYSALDAEEEVDIKLVAKMINDKGGLTIQGQKYNIQLVGEDGKSSLDGCTAGANKLVLDEKVKFVIGPNGFFAKGSSPVFEANKVLHVSGYNTTMPGEIDSTTPYGFLGFNNPTAQSIVSYKAMKKEFPNVKSVVLVSADDGSIPYVIPKAKKALADLGFTAIGDVVKFPNEIEDFSPIAAKANALNADAIRMELAAPPASANILRGVRALGNQKPFICNANALDVLAIAGPEASNNVIVNSTFTPNYPGNPPLVEELLHMGDHTRHYFGMTPNALWILAQVFQAANSLDPAVVKAKWESMDTVSTLYGKGTLCGDETYGLHHHIVTHPLPYAKLVNGQVVPCDWIDPGPIR